MNKYNKTAKHTNAYSVILSNGLDGFASEKYMDYKCDKCGLLNKSKLHEDPTRGTWVSVKCAFCNNKGTSWDKNCRWNRKNYEIPRFTLLANPANGLQLSRGNESFQNE